MISDDPSWHGYPNNFASMTDPSSPVPHQTSSKHQSAPTRFLPPSPSGGFSSPYHTSSKQQPTSNRSGPPGAPFNRTGTSLGLDYGSPMGFQTPMSNPQAFPPGYFSNTPAKHANSPFSQMGTPMNHASPYSLPPGFVPGTFTNPPSKHVNFTPPQGPYNTPGSLIAPGPSIIPPVQSMNPQAYPAQNQGWWLVPPPHTLYQGGLRKILLSSPHEMIIFDLSSPTFGPMQYSQTEAGLLEYLPVEELEYQVTERATTQLDIQCGPNFDWLIEFRLVDTNRLAGRTPPPITVGDALVRIFQFMGEVIEEAEWANIPVDEHDLVRKAHVRRCSMLGAPGREEKEKGPKKIDYFQNDVWFGGLVVHERTDGKAMVLRLSMFSGDKVLML